MEYLPHTESDVRAMLEAVGARSVDDLFEDIPPEVRLDRPLAIPEGLHELDLLRDLDALARKNADLDALPCFLGAGAYDHFIPSVVPFLASRSEIYSSYTPYQAEASQGLLQIYFEFQTMISELTGLPIANNSLYDGATALAEAALMAHGVTRRRRILVSRAVHPEYREVLRTYARDFGLAVEEIPCPGGTTDLSALRERLGPDAAAVALAQPNFFGLLEDLDAAGAAARAAGALFVASVNPVSLALLKAPGDCGADIAVGEGQPLGNEIALGGPYFGFLACREEHVRRLPGRLIGETVDGEGRRGFTLTLQTREQHIRREKATSNICTNQGLCVVRATIHLAALGKAGLREAAERCVEKAHYARERLLEVEGVRPVHDGPFFHEFALRLPADPEAVALRLLDQGIVGGLPLGRFYPDQKDAMLFCVTEKRTREEIDRLREGLRSAVHPRSTL